MDRFVKHTFNITRVDRARRRIAVLNKPTKMHRKFNVLILMAGCERNYCFDDGTSFCAKSGDIVFLPQNSSYIVKGITEGHTYSINFEEVSENGLSPFVFRPKNSALFLESFKAAENAWRRNISGADAKLKAEAYNVIYNIIKEYEQAYIPKSSAIRLRPAVDYINREFTKDNIPISALADLCGMSEVSFRSIFIKTYGITPIKHINALKIERAKELLAAEDHSVTKVAELSGFHDECYFSREFKKHTGMTPTEFRIAVDENDLV